MSENFDETIKVVTEAVHKYDKEFKRMLNEETEITKMVFNLLYKNLLEEVMPRLTLLMITDLLHDNTEEHEGRKVELIRGYELMHFYMRDTVDDAKKAIDEME